MFVFIVEKKTFDVKPGKEKVLRMDKEGSYLLEDVLHHRRFSFRVREPCCGIRCANTSSSPPELVSEVDISEDAVILEKPTPTITSAPPQTPLSPSILTSSQISVPSQISSSTPRKNQSHPKRKGKKKRTTEIEVKPLENLESMSVDDIVTFVQGDKKEIEKKENSEQTKRMEQIEKKYNKLKMMGYQSILCVY